MADTATTAAWETVLGLEVHAQLNTDSKMYCSCKAVPMSDISEANTWVCPVCLGHPGTLPRPNRMAVVRALTLALKLGCRINVRSVFARKNYFYPDLPKGYQISQFDLPLAEHGVLHYWHEDEKRKVRIQRIHLEEDTAKLFHQDDGTALLDYNRSSIPLLEVVTEPDFRDGAEAVSYLHELRNILRRMDISNAEMSEGSMRCEPNVSVRPEGSKELRTKTEVKNLNSFAKLRRAVESETERQIKVYGSGGEVHQATMRYDENLGATAEMRRKETADDYRYFDCPDIPPLVLTDDIMDEAGEQLKRSTFEIRQMMVEQDKLPHDLAAVIADDITLHSWYRQPCKDGHEPRDAAKWVTGDLVKLMREGEPQVGPEELSAVLKQLADGNVTLPQARQVFEEAFKSGESVDALIAKHGFAEKNKIDYPALCAEIIEASPEIVGDIRSGKMNALQVLVGQIMKRSRGGANPEQARAEFLKQLGIEN